MKTTLERADSSIDDFPLASGSEIEKQWATWLMSLLCSCCEDKTLRVLPGLPRQQSRNGFAGFHLLVNAYTPSQGARKLALLKSILGFSSKGGDFNGKLVQLQWLIAEHDSIDANDVISDSIKYSLLLTSSQPKINEHLQLHSDRMKDFSSMLAVIQSYCASKRTTSFEDMLGKMEKEKSDAMEVDALTYPNKGGGSGKPGKGKAGKFGKRQRRQVQGQGKHHDAQPQAVFQGNCNFCKKWGHMGYGLQKEGRTNLWKSMLRKGSSLL
jgi:hypothetical protein